MSNLDKKHISISIGLHEDDYINSDVLVRVFYFNDILYQHTIKAEEKKNVKREDLEAFVQYIV